MPNGKIGDHPLTDLFVHGIRRFPDDICEMLLKIRFHTKQLNVFDDIGVDWDALERGKNLAEARIAIQELLWRMRSKNGPT